jgi:hypothetical protein
MQRLGASQAPHSLGAFQMAIGRRRDATQTKALHAPPRVEDVTRYLERWQRLDTQLQAKIKGPAVCFGASEAAGLLRAYAPRAWASVRACATDGSPKGRFGDVPIIPIDAVNKDAQVLLGVRPADQSRLADRFAARFRRVVTWYDLVDEPHV